MNTENDEGMDTYELAMLARGIDGTPSEAVDKAWELFEAAKRKFEGIGLQEGQSPESKAAWEEWEREKADHLASVQVSFVDGIKWITRQARADRARQSFKDLLAYKAKARGELTSDGVEARADAMLIMYLNKGFTGTEAKKLRAECDQLRGKGRQGQVLKPVTDGRLRENRKKKLQAKGKAAMSELTKEKPEWRTAHYRESVLRTGKGKKARVYRDSADQKNDTTRGQTFDANPALQAALNDPARA